MWSAPFASDAPAPAGEVRNVLCRLCLLVFALFMALTVGCASASPGESPKLPAQPTATQQSTSNCRGEDYIREVRTEYEANPHRARQTYIGKRQCVTGTITEFPSSAKYGISVSVDAGAGADFSVAYWERSRRIEFDWDIPPGLTDAQQDAKSAELQREYERLEQERIDGAEAFDTWVMTLSVGDSLAAECEIWEFMTPEHYPDQEEGIPLFGGCELVD